MKSLASVEVLAEIRGRLRNVRVDDRARWGKMTAKRMVRHLICSYEMALGERTVEPVKGPPPVVMKWVALRSGFRWPKNVQTVPELKRAIAEHSEVEFDILVRAAVDSMEAVASRMHYAPSHPMFGPMTPEDWMRWGYLHADHHLRQFGR
jgi:DinB superfamily